MTKTEFDALSLTDKRIFLAKDVIAQLQSGSFQAKSVYFAIEDELSMVKKNQTSAKEYLKDHPCEVCAKGALVCSYVKHFNELSLGDLDEDYGPNIVFNATMIDIWGVEEWSAIEQVFERNVPTSPFFHASQPKERMIMIMEYIIEWGDFVSTHGFRMYLEERKKTV